MLRREPARILFYILHCGGMYGTERMALATLEGMSHYDKRVVFSPITQQANSVAEAARLTGYETVAFGNRLSLIAAIVPWMFRYQSIDVIGTGVVHNAVCYVLAKIFRVKIRQVHVAHGGTPDSYIRKASLNHIPVSMVAVSAFVRDALVGYGVRASGIVIIENFLSAAQIAGHGRRLPYRSDSEISRPLNRSKVNVAIVSRLDPIKKLALLVQAVAIYGLFDFQFDIYGTGSEIDSLKASSVLMPNLRIHGYVKDVSMRLKEADILLHLCPEEPFGLVVLEGFLSEVVVIVPDSGGAGALVEERVTGLHFKPDDVADLVCVLLSARAMGEDDLQRMADAARETLETRFSPSEGALRYRNAFDSVSTT